MMISAKFLKGSLAATALNLVLFFPTAAAPLSADVSETAIIGIKGGNIMAEDPANGMSVSLSFPAGALNEETEITLLIHGTRQPGVLSKCHINGISVLPASLLFQEKVEINIYNPPVEVTEAMVAYRVVNSQFIIPLGNHEQHIDEGWISGTIYSTGRFSMGTPTAAEVTAQCRKLAAWDPARPLAYGGEATETPIKLLPDIPDTYIFNGSGGPNADLPPNAGLTFYSGSDNEECMRWQKALTKVEAHLTWVQQHQWTGNTEGEKSERANAENALQEAIDGYLKKASPTNRCGSYIKAAAKYLDRATSLGMNILDESPIAQQFHRLVDECSFVFTVEEQIWANHPKETAKDGHTFEKKSNYYTTLKCYIPWNDFSATGNQKVRGEGNGSLHDEYHWVGDEKNEHIVTDGTWRAEKIEGAVTVSDDGHGQLSSEAQIKIYWTKRVTTHMWGKKGLYDDPYDETGTDTQSYSESKSYPLKNGYEEKTGNSSGGMSVRIFILKQPGDGRDDPNDCF